MQLGEHVGNAGTRTLAIGMPVSSMNEVPAILPGMTDTQLHLHMIGSMTDMQKGALAMQAGLLLLKEPRQIATLALVAALIGNTEAVLDMVAPPGLVRMTGPLEAAPAMTEVPQLQRHPLSASASF